MPNQIFQLTDLNTAGICHAISCKWVRESIRRAATGVTSEADLGSRMAMFMMYELPPDMDAIITTYHLTIDAHESISLRDRSLDHLVERLTRGTGYKLLGVGSFRLFGDANLREGHTMAMRRITNSVQFFDPNEGAWDFANTRELVGWLPTFLQANYRDLLGTSSDIWTVSG